MSISKKLTNPRNPQSRPGKNPIMKIIGILFLAVSFAAFAPVSRAQDPDALGGPNIGERLFLETRFAEFYFTNANGNPNAVLTNGDPVMNVSETINGPLPGPFKNYSMNCRACHMVEEQEGIGNRTYCDFATRSPVPNIGDGRTHTTRNAMPLVDSFIDRDTPFFLHFDGQFATIQDLVIGTLTGRNYGWKPSEYQTAIHHIANIIRGDNGVGALAQQYGGSSYTAAFLAGKQISNQYKIPPENFMNVSITDTNNPAYVSDQQIVQNIASLMEQYMLTLVFSQDSNGEFDGSPYDTFLIKNGLPRAPDTGETQVQYGRRLLRLVAALSNPQWVSDPDDGSFLTNAHGQDFAFGTNELIGLEIFLIDKTSLDVATNLHLQGLTSGVEVGNCISCHAPPAFTDFIFHNNGAEQDEFDAVHGNGAFMALPVPGYSTRLSNYDAYLPATPIHTNALGTFELAPTLANPGQADLGLWNVFANPDFPGPQPGLQQILPQLLNLSPPLVGPAMITSGQFSFSATNGPPGGTYRVLTATNLLQPLNNWTVIATNNFDDTGHCNFTNPIVAGGSAGFYRLVLDATTTNTALPSMIALFKTPTVRDLVSSEPYLHTGQKNTIEDVLSFYQVASAKARAGTLRNGDPQMSAISFDASGSVLLAAFLRSLNESAYVDIPCPCGIIEQ
jgi:hypothetical protein